MLRCLLELLTTKKLQLIERDLTRNPVGKKMGEKMNWEIMSPITHQMTLTIEELHKDLKAYKLKKFETQ